MTTGRPAQRPRFTYRVPARLAHAGHGLSVATIAAYPRALAWSTSGALLAVAAEHGDVALIDPVTCAVRRLIRAHAGPVRSIAWHPQRDALLTTGQDGAARLWESPHDAPIELIAPGRTGADHACWSASGDRAAVALARTAHVISTTGTTVVTEPVASTIAALAFAPSGKSLGVASHGGVRLFDPSTGRTMRRLGRHRATISMAFAPDGDTVVCGCQDNSVHLWRIASGRDVQVAGCPAAPRTVTFSHDGRWLAIAGDDAISLWPVARRGSGRRRPVQLSAHDDVVALAYAPIAELLLSGARDGTVALWAPPARRSPVAQSQLTGAIAHVAWGVDGSARLLRWAAADEHGRVLIGQL